MTQPTRVYTRLDKRDRQSDQHAALLEVGSGKDYRSQVPYRIACRSIHGSCDIAQELGDRFVCDRVDAHVTQLLFQPRVPVILDVVIGSPRHLRSY